MQSMSRVQYAKGAYKECNHLRSLALQLRATIRKVEGVSVNASIIANQTGTQMRIFSELATQIEKSSQVMNKDVDQIIQHVSYLNQSSLKSTIIISRLVKFQQSKAKIISPRNLVVLNRGIQSMESRFHKELSVTYRGSIKLEKLLKNFEKLNHRLFVCLTAIRVEGDILAELEDSVNTDSLIHSLEVLLEELTNRYENFRESCGHFRKWNYLEYERRSQHEERNLA